MLYLKRAAGELKHDFGRVFDWQMKKCAHVRKFVSAVKRLHLHSVCD